MKTIKNILLVLFIFSHYSIFATVYYVKPGGNDDSSGISINSAWKTLHKVGITSFYPDDTIRFEGGSIFEPPTTDYIHGSALWINSSGSEGKFIVFNSYSSSNGNRAIIQLLNFPTDSIGIFAKNKHHLVIENINVRGAYNPFNQPNPDPIINNNGIWILRDDSSTERLKSVYIDSCDVSKLQICGINFSCYNHQGGKSAFEDVKITNCKVDSIGHTGIVVTFVLSESNWYSSDFRPSKNIFVYGNIVTNVTGLISSWTVNSNGFSGNGIFCSDLDSGYIERNLIHDCGQLNFRVGSGAGPGGIDGVHNKNLIIQFNEVYNQQTYKNDGNGIHLDRGNKECIMQYNYSHSNEGVGFGLYTFSGPYFNHVFYPLHYVDIVSALNIPGFPYGDSNNTIRYNISQANGTNGTIYNGEISIRSNEVATNSYINVFNNTVYSKTDLYAYDFESPNSCIILNGKLNNIYVMNNIFTTGDTSCKLADIVGSSQNLWNIFFYGNIYWGKENNFKIRDTVNINSTEFNYTDYRTWQNQKFRERIILGYQSNFYFKLFHDPELYNPGGAGNINPFRLDTLVSYMSRIGSIASNNAIDVSQYLINHGSQDFYNTEIPQFDYYDIGACESKSLNDHIYLHITAFIEGLFPELICDTITVYSANISSPYSKIDSAKCFMTKTGKGIYDFIHAIEGSYYIVLNHRNSIETWSSASLSFSKSKTNIYDFSSDSTEVFGGNVKIVGNKYCLYSGDVNQDGIIDGEDVSFVDIALYNCSSGYVSEDLNGDNIVDSEDLSICDNNAANSVSVISP